MESTIVSETLLGKTSTIHSFGANLLGKSHIKSLIKESNANLGTFVSQTLLGQTFSIYSF